MREWTKRRKTDFVIGCILQLYLCFPWVRHFTAYEYLFRVLKMNDYVRTYNETFLTGLKEAWEYTKYTAFVFLIILILIVLFQLVELIQLYCIFTDKQRNDYRGLFLIIFLIVFAMFVDNFSYVDMIEHSLSPLYISIYMIMLLVVIGLWILVDALLDTWESENAELIFRLEEQEKKALLTKVQILEERYQEMLKSRKIVHDMRNHILALKKYELEHNWIGLHHYLNELSDDILSSDFHVWTGNQMLDMILNQKEKDAQNQKINMQIDAEVFTHLPFTDREIISLFGNLLDNAVEACERVACEKRWIQIKIKKNNQLLYIEITNAIAQMPNRDKKGFISDKKETTLHGYGMKNVHDIVEKYGGIFQHKVYEDHLIFMISFYNNSAQNNGDEKV